jgi:hypothetical protein
MSNLVEIVKSDARAVGSAVGSEIKHFAIGFGCGTITPFALNSGFKSWFNISEQYKLICSGGYTGDFFGKIIGMSSSLLVLATTISGSYKWSDSDPHPELLGVLAATNVADYLYNAYKRSKQLE